MAEQASQQETVFNKDKEAPKHQVAIIDVTGAQKATGTEIEKLLDDGYELLSHVVFADNSEHLYFKRLKPVEKK